jgi:hypothetical protein
VHALSSVPLVAPRLSDDDSHHKALSGYFDACRNHILVGDDALPSQFGLKGLTHIRNKTIVEPHLEKLGVEAQGRRVLPIDTDQLS